MSQRHRPFSANNEWRNQSYSLYNGKGYVTLVDNEHASSGQQDQKVPGSSPPYHLAKTTRKCVLCHSDSSSLHKLMKKCHHASACLSCLRDRYIIQAQKDVSNYPLHCFDPQCNRTVRGPQIQAIAHCPKEVTQHYRMVLLARAAAQKFDVAQCIHCTFPCRLETSYFPVQMVRCRNCQKDFPATTIEFSCEKQMIHRANIFHSELDKICKRYPSIQKVPYTVATNILALMVLQRNYAAKLEPWHVNVGFHYTGSENRSSILKHGLLTTKDRLERNIHPRIHGSSFGSGIYTASSPFAFCGSYGELGFLVARLIGNKDVVINRSLANEFSVLSTSPQCVVLLEFSASSLRGYDSSQARQAIAQCQTEVQRLLDQAFPLNQRKYPGSLKESSPNNKA